MSNYYGPVNETATDILYERMFVAGDFISGTGYGIQVVLYTSCALILWRHRRDQRSAPWLLGYITLLIIIETLFCIVQARTVQLMYIDNRYYPGGPWTYFLQTQTQAVNVIFYATLFMLTFLSDLLVLWRCWVIWASSSVMWANIITAFPALLLLVSFVMGTLWTLQSSSPGLSLYSKLPLAYGTSYYTLSLGVNIILTILIILRLLAYRREITRRLPADYASSFVSLATIIVESALLYSLFAIAFLVSYALNDPTNQIFLGFASAAQQIAGYLIIYRIAEGRGWSRDIMAQTESTLTEAKFTTVIHPHTTITTNSASATMADRSQLDTLEFASPASPSFSDLTKSPISVMSDGPPSLAQRQVWLSHTGGHLNAESRSKSTSTMTSAV